MIDDPERVVQVILDTCTAADSRDAA